MDGEGHNVCTSTPACVLASGRHTPFLLVHFRYHLLLLCSFETFGVILGIGSLFDEDCLPGSTSSGEGWDAKGCHQ